ncbi:carbon monoxide dehydrogenase [Deinococcus irradiatisoli]|uniref:Carbon monoxide dehydrogenase n=1 Tax=Deinococcus irradiatisoli TaxID=2202254 RepID=A0A2Z3JLC4_9DEIO|nr:xanthine dehydrogenase family protein subunit M [Deinococcus irradiatisoli]AWN22064.1 carbon monoxide dehydrogenase [Deinococcus irradiatisoli]
MYTAPFDYHRASSVDDALNLLAEHPDAKLLAGGHSLIPTMKLRLAAPSALIDISAIEELRSIRTDGDTLILGAGVTHAELLYDATVAEYAPLLPDTARWVGDPMVRNRGTVGGVVAHADPAADYPASLLVLGAQFKLRSSGGERVVGVDDFFHGMFETAMQEGEMLTEIHIPRQSGKGAYEKFRHPASHYAIVGVAAAVSAQGVKIAMTGAGPSAVRLSKLEEAVGSDFSDAHLQQVTPNAVDAGDLLSDRFASAEYRAHLAGVLARRALMRIR